jgi:hypothetical protein
MEVFVTAGIGFIGLGLLFLSELSYSIPIAVVGIFMCVTGGCFYRRHRRHSKIYGAPDADDILDELVEFEALKALNFKDKRNLRKIATSTRKVIPEASSASEASYASGELLAASMLATGRKPETSREEESGVDTPTAINPISIPQRDVPRYMKGEGEVEVFGDRPQLSPRLSTHKSDVYTGESSVESLLVWTKTPSRAGQRLQHSPKREIVAATSPMQAIDFQTEMSLDDYFDDLSETSEKADHATTRRTQRIPLYTFRGLPMISSRKKDDASTTPYSVTSAKSLRASIESPVSGLPANLDAGFAEMETDGKSIPQKRDTMDDAGLADMAFAFLEELDNSVAPPWKEEKDSKTDSNEASQAQEEAISEKISLSRGMSRGTSSFLQMERRSRVSISNARSRSRPSIATDSRLSVKEQAEPLQMPRESSAISVGKDAEVVSHNDTNSSPGITPRIPTIGDDENSPVGAGDTSPWALNRPAAAGKDATMSPFERMDSSTVLSNMNSSTVLSILDPPEKVADNGTSSESVKSSQDNTAGDRRVGRVGERHVPSDEAAPKLADRSVSHHEVVEHSNVVDNYMVVDQSKRSFRYKRYVRRNQQRTKQNLSAPAKDSKDDFDFDNLLNET